ncbi:MAG: tRNA (adenosine(37)-N6)-threonylcarbamoyltransferase complex dimerization subunit type 1 TsaB [Ignavibacteria bacterium]|nr:tRNA (adenosine(37)-N6)-threonylcarbamoyltransferase complex dimerization subunit type 1 TsaB [Ignavibacteria bacterium]
MNILLIESSSKIIEFAYNKNGNFVILKKLSNDHNADDLVFEMKKAFDEQGFRFGEIQYVALSNGPGSFTGLRIGSAVAKGICFAVKSRLVELVTLDIIATKAGVISDGKIITPMIFSNSKSGEFYTCEYRYSDGKADRISEYYVRKTEELETENRIFVINEKTDFDFPVNVNPLDLSETSSMESMYNMALHSIGKGDFSDYYESEPFYMRKFLGH